MPVSVIPDAPLVVPDVFNRESRLVILDAPSVIPDIFNRESRGFAFCFVCEEKETGFRVKPGMTDSGCGWLFLYQ